MKHDVYVIYYQTRKTAFDHMLKHREEELKYHAQWSIFDEIRVVENLVKRCLECLRNLLNQS